MHFSSISLFSEKTKSKNFSKERTEKRFSESCRFRTLAATGFESDMKTASISRFGPFLNLNRFWKRLSHLEEANGQNCWPAHREDCRGGAGVLRCVAAAAPFQLPAYWPPLEESRRVSARRCSAPRTRLTPSSAAAAPFLALKWGRTIIGFVKGLKDIFLNQTILEGMGSFVANSTIFISTSHWKYKY